jgi:hypothetical protein
VSPRFFVVVALAAAVVGCGSRPSYWSEAPNASASVGLNNAVALVDDVDHAVVLLGIGSDLRLATKQSIPVGHNVVSQATSADGFHLFVLSRGDWPPQPSANQPPSLTVIDTTAFSPTSPAKVQQYFLSEPFPNLAIDGQVTPEPRYAVAYQGSGSKQAFVTNPNELVVFDLTRPYAPPSAQSPNPILHTIQSFGGVPQALAFTPPMRVNPAADPRRLLVVQTEIDVTLFDLDHAFDSPPRPEVTVPLTAGTTTTSFTPAGVAIDTFSSDASDARIAVRTTTGTNVYTIAFGPPNPGAVNDFTPTVNLTDVGGVPSDLAFVHTDAGLRLAALVPTTMSAVLVEPDTSLTTPVVLPTAYSKLSLVTQQVRTTGAADVALLWNGSAQASGVALWTLNDTVGQPYFSVQVLDVSAPVQEVSNVPSSSLKVLQSTSAEQFFVLNLGARTVNPLVTSAQATLSIAPDGQRVWAFAQGSVELASISFATLNPSPVWTELPIGAVFDVACADDPTKRALVAIHPRGTVGATLFDAIDPQSRPAHRLAGLLIQEAR